MSMEGVLCNSEKKFPFLSKREQHYSSSSISSGMVKLCGPTPTREWLSCVWTPPPRLGKLASRRRHVGLYLSCCIMHDHEFHDHMHPTFLTNRPNLLCTCTPFRFYELQFCVAFGAHHHLRAALAKQPVALCFMRGEH
jgi:hypothetical protein